MPEALTSLKGSEHSQGPALYVCTCLSYTYTVLFRLQYMVEFTGTGELGWARNYPSIFMNY